MSKLVVTEFVSVDGVFEDPGGAENYEHALYSNVQPHGLHAMVPSPTRSTTGRSTWFRTRSPIRSGRTQR